MRSSWIALSLLTFTLSTLADIQPKPCQSLPSNSSDEDIRKFLETRFDYIIIGGGTAGLAVANRLSENESINVGVLEAGIFHQNDPNIEVPANGNSLTFGNPDYDWNFQTIPQSGVDGRQISVARGRMLGGSSALNALTWNRASKGDYDSWEYITQSSLWNWEGILPYFRKAETVPRNQANPFPGISSDELAQAEQEIPQYLGTEGIINASLNVWYSDIVPIYVETVNAAGIDTNADLYDGSGNNIYNSRSAVDKEKGVRSYAANRYYCDASFRPNLKVLTNAHVTKILFANQSAEETQDILATGVAFRAGSADHVLNVTKEVILSAGSIQTPQLLELSGIGNSSLLTENGISVILDLPGVGENLQDQPFVPLQFQLTEGHHTFDQLRNNQTFAQEQQALYDLNRTGILAATDSALTFVPFSAVTSSSRIETFQQALEMTSGQTTRNGLQKRQFEIQQQWLGEGTVPQIELLPFTKGIISPQEGESYLSILPSVQHPASRGSVHLNSSDPLIAPVIDLQFLNNDYDIETLLETVKFGLNLSSIAPLREHIKSVTAPTATGDEDLKEYIRSTVGPGFHVCCTASIGPQEDGGVVNERLLVHGTSNVRIVDASVIPMIMASHMQETVYAIGEKAADIIKGSWNQ